MKFFKKKKLSPEVVEAELEIIALLRKYRPYAISDERSGVSLFDEDSMEYKAFWAIKFTLHSGYDEAAHLLDGQKTKMFSAKQLRVLLEEGNEDVRTRILMTPV